MATEAPPPVPDGKDGFREGWEPACPSDCQFRAVIDNAHDAIFVVQDAVIRFHNPRTEEMTGYAAGELAGTPFAEFLHPDDAPAAVERHKRRLRGEIFSPNHHFRVRTKTGQTIWLDVTAVPLAWEGRPAVLCLARDITERRELEARLRQAQKMEAVGALAGGIAHDFNNILAAITGFTELALLEADGSPALKANLKEVLEAGNRAGDLVNQILAFSRQHQGERRPFHAHTVVKEALGFVRASLPSSIEVRQSVEVRDDLVLCDPAEIHQVLVNLCANAGTAMEEKGGRLEVSLTEEAVDEATAARHPGLHPGPYLRLTVSDTGCGIEPRVMERIFEPYFGTGGPDEAGGLGLSLVHGIVKGHGGEILVRSEPDRGTTVDVFLPRLLREAAAAAPLRPERAAANGGGRILFADDEAALVEMYRQMFERLGYEAVCRTSGVEALEAFRAEPGRFDLVVTDLTMPHMSGVELARRVREIRPEIPVILCTGFSEKAVAGKTRDTGIREVLAKPILARELNEAIRRALAGDGDPRPRDPSSILVVDDEAPVRRMLRESLEREGYRVRTAEDGKKALRLHQESPADLVITDIFMPEADGLETIRELREKAPGVRIIAISGGGKSVRADLLDDAKMLGADRIFSKPLGREDLLAAVRGLLAGGGGQASGASSLRTAA